MSNRSCERCFKRAAVKDMLCGVCISNDDIAVEVAMTTAATHLEHLLGTRRSETVRVIIECLRLGRLGAARAEYHYDGDKVHQYPIIDQYLTDVLGCRLHSYVGCKRWMCAKMTASRKERIANE